MIILKLFVSLYYYEDPKILTIKNFSMAKKKNFTKEQIDYIISKYVDERTPSTKIAKEFNCSYNVITRILRENGVEVKDPRLKIDDIIEDKVIPLYKNGASLTKIATIVNIDRHTLSSKLKKLGIKIINRQNETKFDETVFDNIDSEEKAYWLGFIFADGYISSRDNSFELSLKASDVEHLNKFNIFMKHNKNNVKIGQVKCHDKICLRCRWGITNKHLWNTLNSLGCTPKKSLTLKFPEKSIFKNNSLIIHFIRGYFDGDGCLSYIKHEYSKDKGSWYSAAISFEGTEDFLKTLASYFDETYGITKHEHHITLKYGIKASKNILNKLYENSTIYLDRKYNRYLFFKNNCRSAKELAELLASENGEDCDVNPVLTEEIKKSSVV